MDSALAKVLHPLAGCPLIAHVLTSVQPLAPQHLIAVVGHQADAVRQVSERFGACSVVQEPQLGTGHAVAKATILLQDFGGDVLVLCGDVPLLQTTTLRRMLDEHRGREAAVTMLTTCLDDPTGYGRILRDGRGAVTGVVEEPDATPSQKDLQEINSGVYCLRASFLFDALPRVGRHNAQGEQYLTDVVGLAAGEGLYIANVATEPDEIRGVNTPADLAFLETVLRHRREGLPS
jgi:bifunctional UDP-N-acetylglucosamine pyrophosphorylase/glucosamine-1-phosphate N-acetyltransferase